MQNIDFITRTTVYALVLALSLGLTACGNDNSAESDELAATGDAAESTSPGTLNDDKILAATTPPPPICSDCGTISNIEQRTEAGQASGGGAVAGAVLGALVGREIVKGDRDKRNLAGAAGAVGGGYAGHKIEQKARSTTYYVVSVRMDDGRTETVTLNSTEGLSTGQKVRVQDGNIILR